ncbi:MAG: NAD(P)H-hydrate dehydratase [Alphaproteobacteria bacterium]
MTMQENTPNHWSIPPLSVADHKHNRGHVLVYGGAVLTGASRLTARAAQRTGAGLVTLAAPEAVWPIYAMSLLSILTRPLRREQDWQILLEDPHIGVVILGPGAEADARLAQAIAAALVADKKLLLDADALTLLARDDSLRAALKGHAVILTPHEGEYAKLATALHLDKKIDKPARAGALAQTLGVTVLLKGADTVIADAAGNIRVNHHAPPWLATAGTGDVLAGMIGGLWVQGMSAFDAASAAAWLHGKAAARLTRGMIAEDLLAEIPAVLSGV